MTVRSVVEPVPLRAVVRTSHGYIIISQDVCKKVSSYELSESK